MSDLSSGAEPSRARTLLERLSALLLRAPEDREQLLQLLRQAHADSLLDAEALSMIEGVLQVAELSAADLMVPRGRADVVDIGLPPAQFIEHVVRTGHSRLPVVDGDLDHVIGIVHAKDLLRCNGRDEQYDLRALVRPAVFIPESKRLNDLLRDFRSNRQHLAMVVNEYGDVSGLITIEDVLEQIVGDIEDEFDLVQDDQLIVAVEPGEHGPRWRVQARAAIELVNERLDANLPDGAFNTIGGLVTGTLGHVPHRDEVALIDDLRIEVLRADARQPHLLLIERMPRLQTDDDLSERQGDADTEPDPRGHSEPDRDRLRIAAWPVAPPALSDRFVGPPIVHTHAAAASRRAGRRSGRSASGSGRPRL